MKVSLVVAQGVHQGKVIPIPVAQFVIGRDEGCHLRPASPAISKKHCAIVVDAGKILIRDYGSTNGTFVNDEQVSGEKEIKNGDKIRIGPLEFSLKLQATASKSPSRDAAKPAAVSIPTPPPKDEPTKEETVAKNAEDDPEHLAAMLLGTDDGPEGALTPESIPGGSTVFELPAGGDPNQKPDAKKAPAEEDNSKRAAEILRKYMQRPRMQ
jgi:predicted component of type VI protein secretion system